MPLDSYLKQVVQGYTFGDLASMAKAEHDPEIGGGACGYPMVGTAVSAMEALGFLLRSDADVANRSAQPCPQCGHREPYRPISDTRANVGHYWEGVLAVVDSAYGRGVKFIPALVGLVRNPLAHGLVTAPGISVYNVPDEPHLVPDPEYPENLTINSHRLAADLRASYYELVPRVLAGEQHRFPAITATRASMERRFEEVGRHYLGLAKRHRTALGLDLKVTAASVAHRGTPSVNMSFQGEIITTNVASRNPADGAR